MPLPPIETPAAASPVAAPDVTAPSPHPGIASEPTASTSGLLDLTLPPPPGIPLTPEPTHADAPGSDVGVPDLPVPEELQVVEPEPEPETDPEEHPDEDELIFVVQQAHLDKPGVHSICSLQMKPDYDEITPALAWMDRLEKGEYAIIRFDLRPAADDARSRIQEMYSHLQVHEPIDTSHPLKKFLRDYLGYGIGYLAHLVQRDLRRSEPPTPPWRRLAESKPPPRHLIPEEANMAIKFAQEKVEAHRYFEGRLHIGAIGRPERERELRTITTHIMEEFSASYSNGGTGQGFVYHEADPYDAALGLLPVENFDDCWLSPPELGEMMKVPDVQTKSMAVQVEYGMRTIPPRNPIIVPDPLNPPPGIIPFGEINVDTKRQAAVGLPVLGLNTHMYLVGSTGTGKSTLLEWFIFGLVKAGKPGPDGKVYPVSICLIDPHGTLVDNVLKYLLAFCPERAEDIIVFDFGDTEWPISFNPISIDSVAEIESTVNSVKEMILKMLNLNPDAAPRAVQYVEQAVWTLCETNVRGLGSHKDLHLTLLQVPDFFLDYEFRQLCMQFCSNLAIRQTFDPQGPFETLGQRQQMDHVMPVLRTFGQLATKDSFSNIFGQSQSKMDFAKMVRDRKIMMMKLPAIAAGDATVATFIGAMVTPMLIGSLAKWKDDPTLSCYLIIDEFQNYATESFHQLLAQTRKWGLHAIAANQVPQDLPSDVLRGVQSNTQTKISMRLDPRAVKEVADFIASGQAYPRTDDILALPNYWGWVNHMKEDGTTSGPFVFRGLAPALDPKNRLFKDRYEEGKANYDRLLPQVTTSSRLQTAVPRDEAAKARQTHLQNVRVVLERKVKEMMSQGAFDGPSRSVNEEIMDDQRNKWTL